MQKQFLKLSGGPRGSDLIRGIIRSNIENKRRYMARLKFQKEKSELKANDPQAETPKKKRGRPKDPRLLQKNEGILCGV